MITFKIHPEYRKLVDKKLIKKAVQTTLDQDRKPWRIDINIIIENSEFMIKLVEDFTGEKKVTDVMSFNADFQNPETGRYLLGEIVICYPQAVLQAKRADHPSDIELLYLAVHGTLHLLGFDHASAEEKNAMWNLQSKVLNSLGCPNVNISES